MNPQLQNYQRYAQAQSRAPNARRPGECTTSTPFPLIAPGRMKPTWNSVRVLERPVKYNSGLRSFVPGDIQLLPTTSPSEKSNSTCEHHLSRVSHPLRHPLLESEQASQHRHHPVPPKRSIETQQASAVSAKSRTQQICPTLASRAILAHTLEQVKILRIATECRIIRQKIYQALEYPINDRVTHYWREAGPPQNPNIAAQQHQQQLYQQQMAQRNAALEHQLAQRRAKKPTDRNMPEGVEDLVVGDGVQQYKDLRDVEKKLDFAIMRKRLDIQDTVNRNVKRQKTMRIWVSNTVDSQPWQRPALDENSFDFESGADAIYRVKVEGKILDDQEDDLESDPEDEAPVESEGKPPKTKPQPKKFSHYFKAISVEFDKARNLVNPNVDPSTQIEWKKSPQSQEFDCFEFTRKGDENQNITINLTRDEPVERYRLSKALSDVLDIEEADRAEVVMGIWEYVKAMGLQDDDERRHVRCDEKLRAVFNAEAFLFPQVAERIMPHLHPLPPVKLSYTIRVDQEFHTTEPPEPTIYDIKIVTDDPLRSRILAITSSSQTAQNLRQITNLDDQLAVIIQGIQHHKAKHTFYRNFNRDPVAFLKKWYSSQQRDLSVILGEIERGDVAGLEFAKGGKDGVWGSDIVEEAVRYRLARGEASR